MIEVNINDSALSEDGVTKSCTGSSILRASLKTSKIKIDEFFRGKSYDFRKRTKRIKKDDNVTNNNIDNKDTDDGENKGVRLLSTTSLDELNKKRKVSKVSEFLSPILSIKKIGGAFHKTLTDKKVAKKLQIEISNDKSSESAATNSSLFIRQTAFWHESIAKCDIEKMDKKQLDRQEAIFELFKSEIDLIEDLQMICNTYRDSMRKLGLLNDDELMMIFGELDSLIPIHKEIAEMLVKQRLPDGRTEFIGNILLAWIPKLIIYVLYCTNQIFSKDLLDFKIKDNEAFKDFLNRCLNSPFSRKLDLWTFLDLPRSRLVKYPLMFKNIHKYTDCNHEDYDLLLESIDLVEEVIRDVDYNTGLARCKYVVDKLEYEDVKQMSELISDSSFIICDGILKNRRGMKMHVFIFDKVMVMTRPTVSKNNLVKYRVYRKPVAMNRLFLIEPNQLLKTDTGQKSDGIIKDKLKEIKFTKRERPFFSECLVDVDHDISYDKSMDLKLDMKSQQHDSASNDQSSKSSSESFSSRASSSFRSVFSGISNQSLPQLSNAKDGLIELVSYSDQEDNRSENGLVYFGGRKTRYTFKADNDLDKQHWVQCLKQCVRGCITQDRRSSLESTVMNPLNKEIELDKYSYNSVSLDKIKPCLIAGKFAAPNKTRISLGRLSSGAAEDCNKCDISAARSFQLGQNNTGVESGCFDSTLSSYSSMMSVFSTDSGFDVNRNNRRCICRHIYHYSNLNNCGDCERVNVSNECLMCVSKTPTNENIRPKYLASTNLEDL